MISARRMGRKLERSIAPYFGRDMAARLLDRQRRDDSVRQWLLGSLEGTELRAIRDLAISLFGADDGSAYKACIQITEEHPGKVQVGFFTDPKQLVDGAARRRVILFIGGSHREIVDQVRIWKASRS